MEIKVLKDILNANSQIAEQNRKLLTGKRIMAINLMSSPGSGKTTLIMRTVEKLEDKARIAVIEGDVSSSIDAEKLSQAGVTAIQINTGGGCHLDASMVNSALANLPLDDIDILFIENVGNLICPGGFDLGEYVRVVILSTPEGDDKPHKYPLLFSQAHALVVNKTDLLPHVAFDMEAFARVFQGLNQQAALFQVSGVTGEGIEEWAKWVTANLQKLRAQNS
ncbi:MAG TPA: hydrogenase nickel incorporation protein HypB [Dehalococcoidia bacterium]|nr:hydrogenase nickel incorporation protein HypB [Dehalococcoidia bacterium]